MSGSAPSASLQDAREVRLWSHVGDWVWFRLALGADPDYLERLLCIHVDDLARRFRGASEGASDE